MDGRKAHGRLRPLALLLACFPMQEGDASQGFDLPIDGAAESLLAQVDACPWRWLGCHHRSRPAVEWPGIQPTTPHPPSTDRRFLPSHHTQQVSSKEPVHAPCRPPPPPATTPPDSDNHSHQQQLSLALLSKHVHNQARRLHVSAQGRGQEGQGRCVHTNIIHARTDRSIDRSINR